MGGNGSLLVDPKRNCYCSTIEIMENGDMVIHNLPAYRPLSPLPNRLRFGAIVLAALIFAFALTALAPTRAQGNEACPSSWPIAAQDGTMVDGGHGIIEYSDFHTDSEGRAWFVILSTDSNGNTVGRANPADDRYETGYAPGVAGLAILYRQGRPVAEPECWRFDPADDDSSLDPPVAGRRPYSFSHHGITLDDPWRWLQDPNYPDVDDPAVLAYLRAENSYFNAVMGPYQGLIDTIFNEIAQRQPAALASLPGKDGDWYCQWEYGEGSEYRQWYRWPASDPSAREGPTGNAVMILDEVALAEGQEFFRLGTLQVSNSGSLMASSTDTTGAERYTLVVKNLDTGELLSDVITDMRGHPVWSPDDSSFFYTALDETGRTYQVRRHVLGDPSANDVVVHEEMDSGLFVWVGDTDSGEYVLIATLDHVNTEYRLLAAADPTAEPVLVAPRRAGHEYYVGHQGDRFIILTNDNHPNRRIATAPEHDPTPASWQTLLQGSESLYIRDAYLTRDYVAVNERIDGLDQVRIIDREGRSTHVEFPGAAYQASIASDPEFDGGILSSFSIPP